MVKPRSAKAKGTRLEKYVAEQLNALPGVQCRRQPGSGIYRDFPHDNWARVPHVGDLVIECKARKEAPKVLTKWLGVADLLVIKQDYQDPSVYMPWRTFKTLIEALADKDAEG